MIQCWAGKRGLLSSHTPSIPSFSHSWTSWANLKNDMKIDSSEFNSRWSNNQRTNIGYTKSGSCQVECIFLLGGKWGQKYVEHHSGNIDQSNTKRGFTVFICALPNLGKINKHDLVPSRCNTCKWTVRDKTVIKLISENGFNEIQPSCTTLII